MPVILNRLPIPEHDTVAFVGAEQIRIRADQIIVWVSLAVRNTLTGTPEMRRFPVLLDTGMNHYFALQERHLTQWAGLALGQLDIVGRVRERGQSTIGCTCRFPATNEVPLCTHPADFGRSWVETRNV